MRSPPDRYMLVGASLYHPIIGDAFLEPVFGADDRLYLQLPDRFNSNVSRFLEADIELYDEIDGGPIVSVGDPLQFCFSFSSELHYGTLSDIQPLLESVLSSESAGELRLQIAQLLERQDAATEILNQQLSNSISAEHNPTSTGLYSTFVAEKIWTTLSRSVDVDSFSELSNGRRLLFRDFSTQKDAYLGDDAIEWLEREFGIKWSDLAIRIRHALSGEPAKDDQEKHLDAERARIASISRQEGRIASIIRRLVENPGLGERIVRDYWDDAAFANRAILFLRQHADDFTAPLDGAFALYIVGELYKMAYPKQRGLLLYELASHLGVYDPFRKAIALRVQTSYSQDVKVAEEEILLRLENPVQPRPEPFPRVPQRYYPRFYVQSYAAPPDKEE
jgi:hypothetical protein